MAMDSDKDYATMLDMMRSQGSKDNPITLQIGTMLSASSVKIDDLTLNAGDLYIADHLKAGYTRSVKVPYVSNVEVAVNSTATPSNIQSTPVDLTVNSEAEVTLTKQATITFTDGLKAGDLVAVMKLSDRDMYVILARLGG